MDPYVKLAKDSVEGYIREGKLIEVPDNVPNEMLSRRAGVFVTLKSKGQLRGCIGTIFPAKTNVAEEIIANAVSAAFFDPRFAAVTQKELNELEYEVSILGEIEPFNEHEHDPKIFGLIVKGSGDRSGLLLPGIEGVDCFNDQFRICCLKAGVNSGDKSLKLSRFRVEKHV